MPVEDHTDRQPSQRGSGGRGGHNSQHEHFSSGIASLSHHDPSRHGPQSSTGYASSSKVWPTSTRPGPTSNNYSSYLADSEFQYSLTFCLNVQRSHYGLLRPNQRMLGHDLTRHNGHGLRFANDADSRQRRSQISAATHAATSMGGYSYFCSRWQRYRDIRLTAVKFMRENVEIITGSGSRFSAQHQSSTTAADGVTADRNIGIKVEVSDKSVSDLAIALGQFGEGHQHRPNNLPTVGLVNAANAWIPGGGFVTGGRHALEEALCCQSTLYAALMEGQNKNFSSSRTRRYLGEFDVLVAPSVEFFRQGTMSGYSFLEDAPRLLTVLSMAM